MNHKHGQAISGTVTAIRRSIGHLAGHLAATALAAIFLAPVARSEDAAAFYKGKVVRFTVSVGVGGGFDAYARMMAPPLGKRLETTVIVENQPGAGGMLALNQQMMAPPDGLRFTLVNGTPAALAQILGQENLHYDLTKVDHLGIISVDPWLWLMSPQSPIKSVADAMASKTPIRFGGTGPTGGPSDGAAVVCEAFHLACRIIIGYRGSAEIALGLQRGELDALYVSDGSGYSYDQSGQAHAIAVSTRHHSKWLPQVPSMYEVTALTPEQQWWLDFRNSINDLGRLMVTAPGTPPDRLALLRTAIKDVLTDPAVVAEGVRTNRLIDFRDAETAARTAQDVITRTTPEQKARIHDVVLKKYYGEQ